MNHIGRDWVGIYKTAAMEFGRNKSPASIDVAEQAIQKLLRELPIANSKVHRELKDALNSLAVLKMKLDGVATFVAQDDKVVAQDVAERIRLTEDAIKEVRTVSYLLYPPMIEEMDLKSAIPWYLDRFSNRSSIKTNFAVESDFGRPARESESHCSGFCKRV